jgi:PAS domain S-box-containing protein
MSDRLKILLIEDDPDDALLIQDMLAEVTSTGLTTLTFDLEWTNRLADGLARLATGGIDVILLDLLLPTKKGLDAFTEVHARAPQVPIIVLSGLADEMLAIETLRQGAQDYLLKGKVDGHLLARATRYAIERQRTEEKLRQRNHQLALLHRASQTFSSTLDLGQVLNTVLEEVRHLLDVTATSIWLTDPETGELVCRQITGPHTEDLRGWRLSPGKGIVGWVAGNNKSSIVPDTRSDERHFKNIDQQTGIEVRSILCVPLRARKDVVGVLELVDTEAHRFKTTDLTLVEPLAATAAIAIENARLYQETDRLRAFNENIVQSMDEGILIYDPAGHITFINPRVAELTGYAPQELIGRHWEILIAPEHLAQVEQKAAQRPQGITGRYETVIAVRGGQHIPIILSARPLFDKEHFTGVLVVCTDITKRVRAEQALRHAEWEKELILDSQFELVVHQDNKQRILWPNRAACELAGATREELIGRFCYEMWPEHSEPCTDCPVALAIKTGQPQKAEKSTPDGKTWVVRGHPVRDVNDNIVGAIEVARDISERKQTEQERARLLAQIQQQAQQMQQIMDTVPEGVLLLDANLCTLLANPIARQALAALGEADSALNKPLTHLGPRPLADVLSHFDDPLPMEIVLPAPSGRAFEVQAQPIGSGETRQWVLTLREVTQERQIQQQIQAQERLATVGQLAAGIAHDFNNIMASIVLYAGMLLRASDLSPQDRQRLDTIRQQGHRAANLVQQILDFARKSVMERIPLDLVPFLKELEKLLTRTLPENIHFHLKYDHDDYIINADPTRLQQVVMNLALNARDAMPQGGKLRFALCRLHIQPGQTGPLLDLPPGLWVRLTVTDTGSGIPPDVLPHVFEPFFTTKKVGKGTGLGLAQVWGIVLQHEGKISVESQVGRGTTFIIYLPALEFPQDTHETLEMPALIEGQGETILVVEDDATTRQAISVILEDLGYRVLAAANGREALALLSSEVVLVLSDVVMPEMGGVALHTALKEKHPEVKMVVITGYPMTDGDQTLLEQGITAWIKKPFSIDEIAQVVREALE